MARRAAAILAALVLAAYGALLFRRCLFEGRVLFWHDVSLAYIPLREFARACIHEHRLPLWCPQLGGGFPVLFEGQAGVFYPLNLVDYWFSPSAAMTYGLMCAVHCLMAAVFTVMLCRALKLSVIAASFAGLTYGFSAFFVCHVMHLPMITVAAWIPLALYLFERLRQGAGWRYGVGLGLVMGLQFLAGFPQMVACEAIALLVFTVAAIIGTLARHDRPFLWDTGRLLACLALAAIVGVGVGYVQLRATKLQADFSERRTAPTAEFLRELSMTPRNLAYFVHPYALGSYAENNYFGRDHYYEVCGYVGGIALLLALVGLVFSPNAAKWPFAALAVLALGLSLAAGNPLYDLMPRVPVLSMFRGAGRNLVLSTLALAALAAMGLDALLADRRAQKLLGVVGLAGFGAMLLLTVGLRLAEPRLVQWARTQVTATPIGGAPATEADLVAKAEGKVRQLQDTFGPTDPVFVLVLLGGLVAGVGGLRLARGVTKPGTLAAALWLTQAAQLFVFGDHFNPTAEASYYHSPPISASIIRASGTDGRVYTDTAVCDPNLTLRGYEGWRATGDIAPYLQQREALEPNRAFLYGLPCADVQYGLVPQRQYDLLEGAVQSAFDRAERDRAAQPSSAVVVSPSPQADRRDAGRGGQGGEASVAQASSPAKTAGTVVVSASPQAARRDAGRGAGGEAILRLLGVTHLISRPERLSSPLPELANFGFCRLYRLDGAFPRCWIVPEATFAQNREDALTQVTSGTVDLARVAVVEGVPPSPQADRRTAERGPGGEATVTETSDTHLTVLANAAADGWLILGDSFHPLWRARVDGVDVPVYRADYVLRGVRVAKGSHRVDFRFDTRPLRDWGAVSLAVLLLALVALLAAPPPSRR